MPAFRKILVALDDAQRDSAALAVAARLAGRDAAALTLIGVVDEPPWYARLLRPSSEEVQEALVRGRRERLEALAAPLRARGVAAEVKVLRGRPYLEVVREALRAGNDLLIKDAESDESRPPGSTDMHLLRTCPCPVWLVRPSQGDRPFGRVLAAVEPPPAPGQEDPLNLRVEFDAEAHRSLNARVLDLAAAVAESEGAELHVVHAWEVPGETLLRTESRVSREDVDAYVEGVRAEAQKALDHLLADHPAGAAPRHTHLVKGPPAEAIPEFARSHGIDLVVMGTVARTGLPSLLIGNTAEAILQRLDGSVLATKPEGFVSPVSVEGA